MEASWANLSSSSILTRLGDWTSGRCRARGPCHSCLSTSTVLAIGWTFPDWIRCIWGRSCLLARRGKWLVCVCQPYLWQETSKQPSTRRAKALAATSARRRRIEFTKALSCPESSLKRLAVNAVTTGSSLRLWSLGPIFIIASKCAPGLLELNPRFNSTFHCIAWAAAIYSIFSDPLIVPIKTCIHLDLFRIPIPSCLYASYILWIPALAMEFTKLYFEAQHYLRNFPNISSKISNLLWSSEVKINLVSIMIPAAMPKFVKHEFQGGDIV